MFHFLLEEKLKHFQTFEHIKGNKIINTIIYIFIEQRTKTVFAYKRGLNLVFGDHDRGHPEVRQIQESLIEPQVDD